MPYLPEENKPNAALVFHASNQCGIMGDLLVSGKQMGYCGAILG
jgi:hypothetical protein